MKEEKDLITEQNKAMTAEKLKAAIEKFNESFRARSFSQRHPELGKMVNCPVCSRRHRSSQICQQRHVQKLAILPYLTELTKFQVFGRKPFAGKRVKPHYSKKRLQLLQRTIELYPLHEGIWPSTAEKSSEVVAMQMARREAREVLEKEREQKRSRKQAMQHRSRRINRGLLQGNQGKIS